MSGSLTIEEKVKKIELNVVVNDTANPVYKIAFLDAEFSFTKSSIEYKDAYDTEYRCHQLMMSVLIRQADEEDKRKEVTEVAQAKNVSPESIQVSIADELRKLAELKNEGIISGNEFEAQKKKLIS